MSDKDKSARLHAELADFLIGLSMIAKSIGRALKILNKEGGSYEEEGNTASD
ncbi:MAG: hypothetical protein IJV41_02380 [Oscillospiraceae bacterium]|nr:hypothetical protein [Oscillospiraceae bacterium]